MSSSRSRSNSKENEQHGQDRSSVGKNKSPSRSKSRSWKKSRSRSSSIKRRRSGSRKRSTSRRRSRSSRRSVSRSRRRVNSRSRSRSRSQRRSPESSDGYRLHVGDLTEDVRKADLEEVFMKYGPLKEIWLASYAPYYAFVVYRDRRDAQDACESADGSRIAGRRIRVSLAKPRRKGPRERFVPRGDREWDYNYSRHSSRY